MCFWGFRAIPLLLMHHKQLSLPQFRFILWLVSHFLASVLCLCLLSSASAPSPSHTAPFKLAYGLSVSCPSLLPPSPTSRFPNVPSRSVRQIVAWVAFGFPIYLTSVPELAGSSEWTHGYTRQQRSSSVRCAAVRCLRGRSGVGGWGGGVLDNEDLPIKQRTS